MRGLTPDAAGRRLACIVRRHHMSKRFRPGTDTWIASDSPSSRFSGVFEDDGETAYFYAYERDASQLAILDAVHIYNLANVTDRERESEVEIVWSSDGLKAGLFINATLHAVLDFESRRGYCRTNFPPPGGKWATTAQRSPWSELLAELFRSSGAA
jgi:hypothetical protein